MTEESLYPRAHFIWLRMISIVRIFHHSSLRSNSLRVVGISSVIKVHTYLLWLEMIVAVEER